MSKCSMEESKIALGILLFAIGVALIMFVLAPIPFVGLLYGFAGGLLIATGLAVILEKVRP